MKKIVINTDGLKENEIDETATRAKALIINSKNEILLGYGFKTYQFIGGHVNDDESITDALIREIAEETGIVINDEDLKPFMKIVHYTRDYRHSGKNRENIIYYYSVKTDDKVNLKNINYDEWEKKGNFKVKKVKMEKIEKLLLKSINKNEMNKLIVDEMLEVLKEYNELI